jgi:hypothetical protein
MRNGPKSFDRRAATQDRYAGGDERDLLLLRAGCPWPPRSTVYNIFRKFQRVGAIWEEPHMTLRAQPAREASPTAASIDSQTLNS